MKTSRSIIALIVCLLVMTLMLISRVRNLESLQASQMELNQAERDLATEQSVFNNLVIEKLKAL